MVMRAHGTGTTTLDTLASAATDVEVDLSTFPTGDGKPMAENFVNGLQMIGLQHALRRLLEMQGRLPAAIGGNQFLYYNRHNRRDNLSPDAYVALDVASGGRNVWFTWVEGKAPDIVFEITSPSTQRQDLSTAPRGKVTLYGQLGVREYYVYDPAAEGAMQPRLRAFALRGEGIERRLVEVALLPDGGVWSALLAVELRPVVAPGTEWEPAGTYLRVIDPATDAPIRVGEEAYQDYRVAREQIAALEQDNQAARARVAALEQDNQAARAQVMGLQKRLTESEQASQERLATVEQGFHALQERLTRVEQTSQGQLPESERARQAAEERARHAEERTRQVEAELQKLRAAPDRAEEP